MKTLKNLLVGDKVLVHGLTKTFLSQIDSIKDGYISVNWEWYDSSTGKLINGGDFSNKYISIPTNSDLENYSDSVAREIASKEIRKNIKEMDTTSLVDFANKMNQAKVEEN